MVAPNTAAPQHVSIFIPETLSDDTATAATQYVDCLKAVVVPIDPTTKHPGSILGKRWPAKASGDPSQIERWWTENPHAGIGIVTGPSNLVVFDLDVDSVPAELLWLKTGLIQTTRLGGSERGHYVFQSCQVFTSGKIKVDGQIVGEIRSGNTIFVASPTPHSKGGEYRWVTTGEVPELPPIALTYLTTKAGVGALTQPDRTVIDDFAKKYVGGEQANAFKWAIGKSFDGNMSLHDASLSALCLNAKGNRCRKIAIYGSNVCRNHGGSARQVVSKARVRVEMASNRLMGKLIEIAFDDSKPAAVQLDAIKDGLNRAGLKPREQVEVGPITPAEEIFADIFTGTREESRRIRGYESPNLEIDQTNLVDHVLDSPPTTAPVDDHAYGGDYAEHVDSDRPATTHRRYDDDRRSMRRSEFHVIGEDALRIANDTRALPPGRSQRRR